MATVLGNLLSGRWGAASKGAKKFLVDDYPLAGAMIIGLGGYALAGGFAAAAAPSLAAGSTVAGAGTASVASTFPMAGVAQTAGAKSGIANFLFGTPGRQFATGTGINVLGQYLSAKGASEDADRLAEENRQFSREMFEKQQAGRRVSFTPHSRGVLSTSRRPVSDEPVVASPAQALAMRKSGVV